MFQPYQDGGTNIHKSLPHRRGAGRQKKLSRVSKIVIAKSLCKRHKSTRSMAKKLTSMGNAVSKDTVHRYLTKDLNRYCPVLTIGSGTPMSVPVLYFNCSPLLRTKPANYVRTFNEGINQPKLALQSIFDSVSECTGCFISRDHYQNQRK